ncbi:hypothetical protein LEP1GSC062_0138 [Leptospira alexanderi serovar Manhao 3 str. L 60]|uniref:Uncharacterized protein n=1 Tax=Leptospira alexanderi serovar Manhao 3 str. L 60 TaxID=1049759 RepID=V6I5E2_9LEPT|nr:hypothetical protein LEP1GSC062_0138 [Leptospira alexanderi serovar Manhao 3 str. L 60]
MAIKLADKFPTLGSLLGLSPNLNSGIVNNLSNFSNDTQRIRILENLVSQQGTLNNVSSA